MDFWSKGNHDDRTLAVLYQMPSVALNSDVSEDALVKQLPDETPKPVNPPPFWTESWGGD